jgi:hypothetical protein
VAELSDDDMSGEAGAASEVVGEDKAGPVATPGTVNEDLSAGVEVGADEGVRGRQEREAGSLCVWVCGVGVREGNPFYFQLGGGEIGARGFKLGEVEDGVEAGGAEVRKGPRLLGGAATARELVGDGPEYVFHVAAVPCE